jgi:predicted ABC-type ATPase
MRPRMVVVAGPPGSGKSTVFPVAGFGVDHFNADDRAAELNRGSFRAISPAIRTLVNQEFELFVPDHIRERRSFAFETTLRSTITFDQARQARDHGFLVVMRYVALQDVEQHLKRIALRAQSGGHAASESVLRAIHGASLKNLPRALRELDSVSVFDNSQFGQAPLLVLEVRNGRPMTLTDEPPRWLELALLGTEYELTGELRAGIRRGIDRDNLDHDR